MSTVLRFFCFIYIWLLYLLMLVKYVPMGFLLMISFAYLLFNCSSRQPNHCSSTLLSSLYSLWKTLGLCDLFLLKGNLTSYSCCD